MIGAARVLFSFFRCHRGLDNVELDTAGKTPTEHLGARTRARYIAARHQSLYSQCLALFFELAVREPPRVLTEEQERVGGAPCSNRRPRHVDEGAFLGKVSCNWVVLMLSGRHVTQGAPEA